MLNLMLFLLQVSLGVRWLRGQVAPHVGIIALAGIWSAINGIRQSIAQRNNGD